MGTFGDTEPDECLTCWLETESGDDAPEDDSELSNYDANDGTEGSR